MTQVGTPIWAAPEILKGLRYDERVDIFSFGVVLSEVKSRSLPYQDVPRNEKIGLNSKLIQKIKSGEKRVGLDVKWGAQTCDLIDRCTRLSPAERPPFPEVAEALRTLWERASRRSAKTGKKER